MLKEWRGVTLLAIVSALFVAGCGSGSGGTGGMTESGTTPRTRAEKLAPPEKKPTHRRGPILAGEVRPVVDGSGEEAWAAGRSIYLTADGGRTWRAAAPVELHGFVGSELVDPAHGWVVAATSSRNPPPPSPSTRRPTVASPGPRAR